MLNHYYHSWLIFFPNECSYLKCHTFHPLILLSLEEENLNNYVNRFYPDGLDSNLQDPNQVGAYFDSLQIIFHMLTMNHGPILLQY